MSNTNPLTENLSGEDWAGEMGERWLASLDRFESMISPVGDALLARADFRPGERVVDVGCGGGASSREIAASVAPGGVVYGLDISPALVAEAARRAAAAGLANVSFSAGDAATVLPPGAPASNSASETELSPFVSSRVKIASAAFDAVPPGKPWS